MDFETLKVEIDSGVAVVTLNRPDVLNALSTPLVAELAECLRALRSSSEVRALVMTGAGRGFCAGADLTDPMMSRDVPREERSRSFTAVMDERMNVLMRQIHDFDRPKIAAVNGVAAGGGVGLALSADITLAARSAYFMQVFTPKLGLVPDLGCTWHLAHRLGRARAVGLAMTGERLYADKAAEWGLIWQALEDGELMPAAMELARKLAEGPTRALSLLPGIIDKAAVSDFGSQLDMERDVQANLVVTEDFEEALSAFSEKRPPRFSGK